MNLQEARKLAGLQEAKDMKNPKVDAMVEKLMGSWKKMSEPECQTEVAKQLRAAYSEGYKDGYNDSPKK